jgi:hypothetical protein
MYFYHTKSRKTYNVQITSCLSGRKCLYTSDDLELCLLTHGRMEGNWIFDNMIKPEISISEAGQKRKLGGGQ